jgi:hypothetical protein
MWNFSDGVIGLYGTSMGDVRTFGMIQSVTFDGMQGFTCVKRRLRCTSVNDDSFIWAAL